jgi:hypothetical protein
MAILRLVFHFVLRALIWPAGMKQIAWRNQDVRIFGCLPRRLYSSVPSGLRAALVCLITSVPPASILVARAERLGSFLGTWH